MSLLYIINFIYFIMKLNNRIPNYPEKVFPKRRVVHSESKDGRVVFVEGAKPNPYEGISCESLKLKSRIDTGVFQNMEGTPNHLEKANGSDIMTAEIEKQQRDYEEKKDASIRANKRKKLKEEMVKNHPEIASLLD